VLLSCAEQMLGDRPLATKLALVRDAGFDGIDLRMGTLSDPDARRVLDAGDLRVGAIYSQIREPCLLSATAAERAAAVDRVVACARAAHDVGAANLIVVPVFGQRRLRLPLTHARDGAAIPPNSDAQKGSAPQGEATLIDSDSVVRNLVGSWRAVEVGLLLAGLVEVAERIADLDVTVTIEPLNRTETYFLTNPAEAAAVCTAVGSPRIATMVDTYHCAREGQDIPAMIAAAGERVALLHLSDTERQLPGDGDIDFAPVLQAVCDLGYTGWMGLECRPVGELDDLRRSVEYLRGVWPAGPSASAADVEREVGR
jgi:sugar phosphate isomerase/epimerase